MSPSKIVGGEHPRDNKHQQQLVLVHSPLQILAPTFNQQQHQQQRLLDDQQKL